MTEYTVNFSMTYTVEAESKDDALAKGTEELVNDLPTLKARHFGASVEEPWDGET